MLPTNGITLDEETHTYWKDDQELYGVTGYFKEIGLEKGDYPEWYSDRGKEAHNAIKLKNEGHELEFIDPQVLPFVTAYIQAKHDLGFETLHSEIITGDPGIKLAGTVDEIALFSNAPNIPNGKYIIDFKSGHKKRLWELQTAGYHICWLREHGEELKRMVLRLKDDATYEVYLHEDEHDMLVFTGIMNLVRWRNASRRVKPLVLPVLEKAHTE